MSYKILLKGGGVLAAGNVCTAIAGFIVISRIFNSVELKAFGSISVILTAITMCQIVFNTQSWQGILKTASTLPKIVIILCVLIDMGVFFAGSLLAAFLITSSLFVSMFMSEIPRTYLLLVLLIGLTPVGAVLAVIRGQGWFLRQAMVDITCAAVKMIAALIFIRTGSSAIVIVAVLIVPEVLRWLGYLIVVLPFLTSRSEENRDGDYKSGAITSIYRFSIWGALTEIVHLPTAHIDKMLVGGMLGLESLAVWDIVKRCGTAIVQATSVVNQILYPHMVKASLHRSYRQMLTECISHCKWLSIPLVVFYGSATLTLPYWFPAAFKLDFGLWPLNFIQGLFGDLALVLILVLAATPIHPLFLILYDSAKSFWISVCASILFFCASYLLLPTIGVFGAPLAILISDAFIIVLKYYLLNIAANDADLERK